MRRGFIASLFIGSLLAIAIVFGPSVTTADDAAAGKAVFEAQKCSMCHSVSAAGIEAKVKSAAMAGPDLSALPADRDDEWLGKYLRKEVQLEGKDHKKAFKGTDEELSQMLAWVRSQQK